MPLASGKNPYISPILPKLVCYLTTPYTLKPKLDTGPTLCLPRTMNLSREDAADITRTWYVSCMRLGIQEGTWRVMETKQVGQ